MTTKAPTSKTVFGKWIQPLAGMVQQSHYKRNCKVLPDQKWIETGLLRVLSQEPSGRAFLQKLFDSGSSVIKRSHFFETLKSNRRLKLCQEVGLSVYEKTKITNRQADPFDRFPALDEYDIYAGVSRYELVGCSAGVSLSRVTFKCPLSGRRYVFITNLTHIPPGLIAYLYKTGTDCLSLQNEMGYRKDI